MLAELVVAGLIVAAVGATTAGGHDNASTAGSLPPADSFPADVRQALVGWGAGALPVITALVGDLLAGSRDASVAPGSPAPSAATDVAALRRDLDRARRLAPPPARAVATSWSTILGLLGRAGDDLARSGGSDTADRTAARSALASAGADLVQLARLIGPPG